MKRTTYLFAAQWEDSTYEVVISSNGEAERRYVMATGLGGPAKISHGPITRKHTDENVRKHIGNSFGIAPGSIVIQYLGNDTPLLRKANSRHCAHGVTNPNCTHYSE